MLNKLLASMATLLLLALPAWAESTWDIVPGDAGGLCSFDRYDICFTDFDATENSPILDMRKCENYTVHFNSNITDTDFLNTLTVRWSVSETASVNTSEIVNNSTLTGSPATGLDVLAGYDAPWIYLVGTINDTDTARASVQCWKRRW